MAQTRIAVAARKGGVGKTSIACGLGSVMASQGKQVLVIDLDPQSNAAYYLAQIRLHLELLTYFLEVLQHR